MIRPDLEAGALDALMYKRYARLARSGRV